MNNITILPGRARRRTVVVVAALLALVVGGGAAIAAWTSTATGSSQAKSRTPVTLTVTAATPNADLYPGGSASVYFTITNSNPYDVKFTDADFSTVASNDEVACPNANITVNDKTGLNIVVPANSTTATLTIANAVTMALAAPDGCQNKVFTVTTALAGMSQ